MVRGEFCVDLGCSRNDKNLAEHYRKEAYDDTIQAPKAAMTCGKLFVAAAYAICADDYPLETHLISGIRALDPEFNISKLVIASCKPSPHEDPGGIEQALRRETLAALQSFLRRHPGFPFEHAFPSKFFDDEYINLNRACTAPLRKLRCYEHRPPLTLIKGRANLK